MRGGATQRSKPEEGAGELRREGGGGATQGGGSGRKARASCTEADDGAAEQAESREGARAAARIACCVGIKGWVFLQIDQRDEYFEPEGVFFQRYNKKTENEGIIKINKRQLDH